VIKTILNCLLLFSLLGSFACNEAADIDADIVDLDLIDVVTSDDFDLSSYTIVEDSVLSFQQAASFVVLEQYPFGIYDDPLFGQTSSTVISQFLLTQAAPDFTNAVVDSVIMELDLSDEQPFYGDTTGVVGIEVVEINETLDFTTEFFTNHVTEVTASPIGTYMEVPNFSDSTNVVRWDADSMMVDLYPPQIRIRLVNNFGQRVLFAPPGTLDSNTPFVELFKGIELRPTNVNGGLIALDFDPFNSRDQTNISGATIQIFYTQNGVRMQYELGVSASLSVKFVQVQKDIAGSTVETFIDGGETLGDSLTFIQGLNGPNIVVSLNDVDRLNGAIINGATLEVFATALNGDEELFPVIDQLVLREQTDDDVLLFTRDFISALTAGNIEIAGGQPEDMGNGIFKYTFNIGAQLQDIIEGISPNEVVIRAANKVSEMNRAVIFGAGHSTYPMKLNVTYTNL